MKKQISKIDGRSDQQVILRYRADQIGQNTIDRICKLYNLGAQLSQIVRQVNGPLHSDRTVNLADAYSVLHCAIAYTNYTSIKVTQRNRYREFELPLNMVPKVIDAWRKGIKRKDLYLIGVEPAIDRLCQSLYTRFCQDKATTKQMTNDSALELLARSRRDSIDGRECLLVFLDEIPEHLYQQCFPTPQEDKVVEDYLSGVKKEEIVVTDNDVPENSIPLIPRKKSPVVGSQPTHRFAEEVVPRADKLNEHEILEEMEQMEQEFKELEVDQELQEQSLTEEQKRKQLNDLFSG